MSEYIKRTWTDGEIIDAEKMNNLETGVTEAKKDAATAEAKAKEIAETAAPKTSPVFTGSISMGRSEGSTVGQNSFASGENTIASGRGSHAEGQGAAIGAWSHAEGQGYASGDYSHAEGNQTGASGECSHAEGYQSSASGDYSHVEGFNTLANGFASHVIGKFNKNLTSTSSYGSTNGDAMAIGNGVGFNDGQKSNAFRVTFAGGTYGLAAFNASGADYAEFFEWLDGNTDAEDRIGYFVTLDGSKIVKAKTGDYILGIVSGNPCIVGNSDEDWLSRWEKDEFGRFIKEEVVTKDKETGETVVGWRYKQNPDYDSSKKYVERKDRKEWDYIGMLGVLAVRDDGSCQINGFCQVTDDGTATAADGYVPGQTYRVMARVAENVVKVVFR